MIWDYVIFEQPLECVLTERKVLSSVKKADFLFNISRHFPTKSDGQQSIEKKPLSFRVFISGMQNLKKYGIHENTYAW